MPITLPPLPFDPAALEPFMSRQTLELHHGKHHQAYVDKTNALIDGTALEGADLLTIVRRAKARGDTKLFNQAGQAWNHEFLWESLRPLGGQGPQGDLAERIETDFGGINGFAEAFKTEATEHFASGWAWLVLDGEALKVISTHDADSAIVHDVTPLLVLDLWEHAYYLDWQNRRPEFVDAYLGNLINWDFAAKNLDAARGRASLAA